MWYLYETGAHARARRARRPGLLVGLTEAAAEGPELILVAQGREAEVRLELGDTLEKFLKLYQIRAT